jgi:hypothetical protein
MEMITPETNNYRAIEHLRDGRQIKALRPDDEADMLVAIGRNPPGWPLTGIGRRSLSKDRAGNETGVA